MHDLTAEWILRANGSTTWRFQQKIADYNRMQAAGTFAQPPALDNWSVGSQAFWQLYIKLTPFRNRLIHGSSFSLEGDTLVITDGTSTLRLTGNDQGAYIRALCLITDQLVANASLDGINGIVVQNDLYALQSIHGIGGLSAQQLRVVSVEVIAPGRSDANGLPSADVDFDAIRRQAERTFPAGAGVLAYEVVVAVRLNRAEIKWRFPALAAPAGTKCLSQGIAELEPYRVI
ncbi:hypothetical protein [Bradyrhizobium sacchari]|uniref:hypothetical protein n=1 Tax=Bradyrhizobium sacchari TaxID=1399419 RepID=UPI0010A97B00|nr:hypothetical protein [Bradyrhizobium sacchari]